MNRKIKNKLVILGIGVALVFITGYFQDGFKQDKKILGQKEKLQALPTKASKTELKILDQVLVKSDLVLRSDAAETTPFVWKGELKYLVSQSREPGPFHLDIYDFITNQRIARFGEGLTMASALVYQNKLYIFGTKNIAQHIEKEIRSEVYLITTEDLKVFSKPQLLVRASTIQGFFNTSVTRNDKTGKFIMALELYEEGLVMFTFRFFESPDMIHWKLTPYIFGNEYYVAAPFMKFINGYYYLWFLKDSFPNPIPDDPNDPTFEAKLKDWTRRKDKIHRIWTTHLARSRDLVDWQISPHTFLAPDRNDEGINTSDVDIVEWNGKTYIFYMGGDQATWTKIRVATTDDSLDTLVGKFF